MESRWEARLPTGLGKRPPSTARVSHSSHSLCDWKNSRSPMKNQIPHHQPMALISTGTKPGHVTIVRVYNAATSVLQFKLEPARC
jgi:hypothetical protein